VFTSVSANIAVAIFKVDMPYIGQAVSDEVDLMVLIGGVEERAAIQCERSMWLRKGGDGISERR
jgi:hypothetical protein